MTLPASYIRDAKPVEVLSVSSGTLARVVCHECDKHADWNINMTPPPVDILPKHFARKGWRIGKRATCPECVNHREEKPMPNNVTPISPPSPAARANRAKAHELLVLNFDADKGAYTDGYSDQRIADECEIPVAWVVKRREEDYGPLKQPSEFAEIRHEVTELASQVGKLQAKLDAMTKRNGWAA